MDVATFKTLLLPSGQEVLQAAQALNPREADFLAVYTVLCRRYPADLSRAALETVLLREKASTKFPYAPKMYFTREALEQASAMEVSMHRTERFHAYNSIVDLGCSIGGDTLALAGAAPTIGLDIDPLRLMMARENMRVVNAAETNLSDRTLFVRADLTSTLPITPISIYKPCALFFDPARRSGHRRAFSVYHYVPPLSIIKEWLPRFPALGVKISPGVDLDELSAYDVAANDVEIEFVSLRGELKEAVLWFGPLRSASRRATLLPGVHTLTEASHAIQAEISQPRSFLYEPDPAVLRAGLVRELASQLGAAQLDPDIAYLTAEKYVPTPFVRVWAVEDWFPFNLKYLRSYLRQRSIGRVTVKKRGSPITPEQLTHDLRLKGDLERVVFLTQLNGRPVIIIAANTRPM